MANIVLIDDHFMVRDGIRALLEDEDTYAIIGEAANGKEALILVPELQPDIVICDIRMPGMSGIETVKELTNRNVASKFIMLSMHDADEYILDSIQVGADGYLLKDASKEEFLKALATVNNGDKYFSGDVSAALVRKLQHTTNALDQASKYPLEKKQIQADFDLTKRERQILRLAVSGITNKEIASTLNISKRTIEVHRFNLMKKMQVKNVLELSRKAREYGLISE